MNQRLLCSKCGIGFKIPTSMLLKYPNWLPMVCFSCHKGIDRGVANFLPSPPAYFTDGAYSWSEEQGGWAAIRVEWGEITKTFRGNASPTSNNRMELAGVIAALEDAKDESISIYTDSQYTVNSIMVWADAWEKQGWKRKGQGEVKNIDLIQRAWYIRQSKQSVKVEWIKGHNGSHWNLIADSIASAESEVARLRRKSEKV